MKMMMKMQGAVVILCLVGLGSLLAADAAATVKNFSVGDSETLRNVLLTKTGTLILGSNTTLRRVNSELVQQEKMDLPHGQVNTLLVGDPGGTYSDNVLSCQRTNCTLHDINDLSSTRWTDAVQMNRELNSGLGLFVSGPGNRSVLTVALRTEIQSSFITRGELIGVGGGDSTFDVLAVQEDGMFVNRHFLAVFEINGFSYYVNKLINNEVSETRLVRICNNDTTNSVNANEFSSYFEIKLECGVSGSSPTAATLQPADQTITLSVTDENSRNLVCVYELAVIHELMTEKYNSCRYGNGMAGLLRNGQSMCAAFGEERLNNPNINECNLVSTLLPSQEVEAPLSQHHPILSLPLSEGQFTSLIHSSFDGIPFLFAGTNNGKIYQYHYANSSSVRLIRSINLFPDNQPIDSRTTVSRLLTTTDGLTLYCLTPGKLFSVNIDVCDQYSTCHECLGEDRDPVCGWCSLENRCSRRSECGSGTGVWVSDSIGSCPIISSAIPPIIYVKQLLQQQEISIDLLTSNIPNGTTYKCIYGFHTWTNHQQALISSVTMEITAVRDGDMFTCSVSSSGVPALPKNQDSLLSNLSLRYQNNDVAVLETPLRFSNCSVHTNCTSCISSDSQCNWCPFSFKCIASKDESCSTGNGETAVMESCPRLQKPQDGGDDYVIHVDFTYSEYPLIIKADSLGEFSESFAAGEFRCVVSNGEVELFSAVAMLNNDNNVECMQSRYDHTFEEGVASLHSRLSVVWTTSGVGIDNPDRVGVILYSCERLGSNCAQCLAIPSSFHCCATPYTCRLANQCTGEHVNRVGQCPLPDIVQATPDSGPLEGGTVVTVSGKNMATSLSQISMVTIGGVNCAVVNDTNSYQPGIQFQCRTGPRRGGFHEVTVEFSYLSQQRQGTAIFHYLTPIVNEVKPRVGPASGGTMVTISGSNLNIGSIISANLADHNCDIISVTENEVVCLSEASTPGTAGAVSVAIDNWVGSVVQEFEYLVDPTVESVTPSLSFAAGGTQYVVLGQNFRIEEPRLLINLTTTDQSDSSSRRRRRREVEVATYKSEPCLIDLGGTRMTCSAPPIDSALFSEHRSILATLGLKLDGVTSDNYSVSIFSNPEFDNFGQLTFSTTDTISLTIESKGEEFAFSLDMVTVMITPCSRGMCVCDDIQFLRPDNKSFTCIVESSSGLNEGTTLTVRVHLGNHNQTVGTLQITGPLNPVVIIVPIVVGFVLVVMVIVVILLVVCYRGRQKDTRYKELIVEMEKLESTVARECKLGFAELQTDLDELTGDVSGHRLPYRDLKVYLLSALFPGSKDHPILHPVQLPKQRELASKNAIKDFYDLCMDRKVLLLFIRTMEEQRGFTIRDKSQVGSLLMVALHNRLDYATEILKMLLSDLISRAMSKSSPKLLLRRTESVAEKMLTNWLAFCLHGYIVEQSGKPLYLLYRAVKSQLEKGPIDVITGEARYSLSEHKLIRQKMDVTVLTVTVEASDSLRVPVKVLTCDTISQVKEKLLDAIYKSTQVSQRPSLTSIDLEYVKSPRDYLILRDEDTSTVSDGGWKQLNTLQHYGVQDGADFRLMRRKSHAPPGRTYDYPASLISSHAVRNRALSEAEDGSRVWHLFKQHDCEDPRRSPFLNKKMITEVYLPRMLSTKNILQKFVSDLFTSLFSVSVSPTSPISYTNFFPSGPGTQAPMSYAPGSTVPMAVKYLLDFLDDAADNEHITEKDVVHTWKNNALALRFWVNMMKNPEFVFDVNKSHTVDACLSVIAGAFIDGCSYNDVKLTIDSPTSKLLYNKEVQEYKSKVRQYYHNVSRLPRIPEDAMQSYMKQLSEYQAQVFSKSGGFVVESALYELLRYANKYSEQLLTNLRNAGLESRAQVFESIVRATN